MELKNRGRMRLATEFISHQGNSVGKKFDIIFQSIIDEVVSIDEINVVGDPVEGAYIYRVVKSLKLLEEAVFNRFGIKVRCIHTNHTYMAVLPMFSNKYHIFVDEPMRGFDGFKKQENLLKTWEGKKGFVDLENAKVSGIFSTYDHLLFMNLPLLINEIDMNARELVAVLFHEIGHLFTNYEFANRLETTNEVLLNLSNELKNNRDQKKIEVIYKQYLDLTGSKSDLDLFTSGKTRVVIGSELFKKHIDYVKSQWRHSKNDETGGEVVADVFSARLGYGNDIIKALDKLVKKEGLIEKLTNENYLFLFKTVFLPLVTILALLMLGNSIGAIFKLVGLVITVLFISYATGSDLIDMTYDSLKVRYIKIREQYIDLIKNSELSNNDAKHILEDIYSMDAIIKSTKDVSFVMTRLGNILFSRHRTAANDIALQRLIEELAHNELFLKSVELNVTIKARA